MLKVKGRNLFEGNQKEKELKIRNEKQRNTEGIDKQN